MPSKKSQGRHRWLISPTLRSSTGKLNPLPHQDRVTFSRLKSHAYTLSNSVCELNTYRGIGLKVIRVRAGMSRAKFAKTLMRVRSSRVS